MSCPEAPEAVLAEVQKLGLTSLFYFCFCYVEKHNDGSIKVPQVWTPFCFFNNVLKKLLLLVCSRQFSLMLEAAHLSRNSSV